MPHFSRTALTEELADELWRYLAPSSGVESLRVERRVVGRDIDSHLYRQILSVHLALAPQTAEMLSAAEEVVHRLPSVGARRLVELDGEVLGDIDFSRTMERRLESGEETLFVCSPVERRFESLHARVLKTALLWCERIGRAAPFKSGPLRTQMETSADRAVQVSLARRATHKLKLAGVRPLESPTAAQLERVEHRFGMKPIADYIRMVRNVLEKQDPFAIARLFRDVVLAPSQDERLFELKVGFDLARCLVSTGWTIHSLQAFSGSKMPFAEFFRGGDRLMLWDQRSMAALPDILEGDSFYRTIRSENGLKSSSLRPDFVVQHPASGTVVVVEVKLTASDGRHQVRNGITDVMAYLKDRPDLFGERQAPAGAVVAWGSRSTPSISSKVMVCSERQISDLADAINGLVTSMEVVTESGPGT